MPAAALLRYVHDLGGRLRPAVQQEANLPGILTSTLIFGAISQTRLLDSRAIASVRCQDGLVHQQ